MAIKKNEAALFVSFGCSHFHVFHTSLNPLFCHRCVCSNIQHPTYELGMQMNLVPPHPPCSPTSSPPFHQCSLSASNSGKAAAWVWAMATDAQVTGAQRRSVSALPSVVGALRPMSAETEISLRRFEPKAAGPCSITNHAYWLYIRPVNVFFLIFLFRTSMKVWK